MTPIPSLAEWLELSEDERARRLAPLNPYAGEGESLLNEIADRFRGEFGHLAALVVTGPGVYHGGSWVIGASHPFVFDRRLVPYEYLGIQIRASISPPLPLEFQGQEHPHGYVWAPQNFERFVDRCADEVRATLGQPNMSRAEMLHALIGIPFEEHLSHCRRWAERGKIPRFE